MLNGKETITRLMAEQIKKYIVLMYKYFHASKYSRANVKVEFALPNYATKTGLKVVTGVDVSSFATKIDLASLKSNVYKLDIDKLKKYQVI